MEEEETVAGELLQLLMELTTGGGAIEEAATAGCGGIGGTKYCGWKPVVEPGGNPGGGCRPDVLECIVGVCGETEMGGASADAVLVIAGGGVGLVAKLEEAWDVAIDAAEGGMDIDVELHMQY